MKKPFVLVACEESGRVTEAFRNNGCIAFSCDVMETSGNNPEWHIVQDVLPLLNGFCEFDTQTGVHYILPHKWDAIIAFPPCTYLTNASAVRMKVNGQIVESRYKKMLEGRNFFLSILNADSDCLAVENPVPMSICNLPKYDQIIQPWQFGHNYSKRTCLWLKNLPYLVSTKIVTEGITPYVNGGCKDAHGNYRRAQGRKERDPIFKSKTFPGVASAMGEQWGSYLVRKVNNE